jgi:hypothetical protein
MQMKNRLLKFVFALLFFCTINGTNVQAQCPMCKIGAESNMKNGGTAGAGLNSGILYMLLAPYVLVGGIAFVWWRNRNVSAESED